MSNQQLVFQFMDGFNQIDPQPIDVTDLSTKDLKNIKLRLTLTLEKTKELFESFLDEQTFTYNIEPLFNILKNTIQRLSTDDIDINEVDIAQYLADLLYINYGSAIMFNIPLQECFEEVHKANMSKLTNFTGNPIYREDGKVLYDSSYTPPNIKDILNKNKIKPL